MTTRSPLRFAALALALSAASTLPALADPSLYTPAPAAAHGTTRAEVVADLHLWIKAGMRRFAGEPSAYEDTPAYEQALATYQRWRHGPEFQAELSRVQAEEAAH